MGYDRGLPCRQNQTFLGILQDIFQGDEEDTMRETDIDTLPGKRMADNAFLCMAALVGTGYAKLYVFKNGKIVFDYDYDGTSNLRRNIFDGMVAKGHIAASPREPGYWFATEAGRQATIDEAGRRLSAFTDALGFPCDSLKSFSYSVTVRGLECMRLVEMSILSKNDGLTLEEKGQRLLAGDRPVYIPYEIRWKEYYDPEGHAADLKAEAEAEMQHHATERARIERSIEQSRIASEARAVARRELAEREAAAAEHQGRIASFRDEIVDLAKGCFSQTARYDDLMCAVERLLRTEEMEIAEESPAPRF
jgi:hypothetical protein